MLYSLSKPLLIFLLAYATVPPEAKNGLNRQLAAKRIAQSIITNSALTLTCSLAHELGHAVVASAVGMKSKSLCIGNPTYYCNNDKALFSVGDSFHLAGLNFNFASLDFHPSTRPINILEYIAIMLAGPACGVLTYNLIHKLSGGRIKNNWIKMSHYLDLVPMISAGGYLSGDGGNILKEFASKFEAVNNIVKNPSTAVYTDALRTGLKMYANWPTTQKVTASRPTDKIHATSLALLNLSLAQGFAIPAHFDVVVDKNSTIPSPTTLLVNKKSPAYTGLFS